MTHAIVFVGVLSLVVNVAIKGRLAYWQRRYVEAKEDQRIIDSTSFDSSLKWAYVRGYADARHGLDIRVGAEAIIIEHRTEFPSTSP
jgi:hypothetical protein